MYHYLIIYIIYLNLQYLFILKFIYKKYIIYINYIFNIYLYKL